MDVAILGVTVDKPVDLKKTADKLQLGFDLIADEEGRLLDLLGLRHAGGAPEGHDIPQSASVLVAGDGRILWHEVAANYRVRPKPTDVLAAIQPIIEEMDEPNAW